MTAFKFLRVLVVISILVSCQAGDSLTPQIARNLPVKPVIVSDTVFDDADDPAIWINPENKDSSLIIGTDKNRENGGLYVFTLDGHIDRQRTVTGLHRMNNVDVAYGLKLGDARIDIVVATERDRNTLRVFSLPGMKPIDGGGIQVYKDQVERAPMGVALYKRTTDEKIFAIISHKSGSAEGYLEQYLLKDDGAGKVSGVLVRKFGKFSGKKEIEAIAVDDELGYLYYSDEQTAIRKYYADPDKGNQELAVFGEGDFMEDNEGISIYKQNDGTGYILVSDQGANRFNVYPREGTKENPHLHSRLASIPVSTNHSDGSDVTSTSLPGFEGGLFVAMSDDKTFQFYKWTDIAKSAGLSTTLK